MVFSHPENQTRIMTTRSRLHWYFRRINTALPLGERLLLKSFAVGRIRGTQVLARTF